MHQDANQNPFRRVAVFYDGTFFQKVSDYYKYTHARKSFINIDGLHNYIRHRVSQYETNNNQSLCHIVEAHYFRGRFTLESAKNAESLERDRLIDQILMFAGVVAHYYPMNESVNPPEEKGIDVWLALEAYDLAVHKKFDVLVLFAGDQDYVPLVRKVNGLGTRVMLIGIDYSYTDTRIGKTRVQKTSQRLIDEASYTVMLTEEVESKAMRGDETINGIFRVNK